MRYIHIMLLGLEPEPRGLRLLSLLLIYRCGERIKRIKLKLEVFSLNLL